MSCTVRVKQLEWDTPRETEGGGVAQDAWSSCGHFIASDSGWFILGYGGWHRSSSLEESKVAAQSDYEKRILAALEHVPVPTDNTALMETQLALAKAENKKLWTRYIRSRSACTQMGLHLRSLRRKKISR